MYAKTIITAAMLTCAVAASAQTKYFIVVPAPGLGASPTVVAQRIASPVLAGVATLSPTSLSFADQQVGTTSATQSVTVTNTGTAPLSLSGIGLSAGGQNFAQSNNCGSIVPNGTCVINVSFSPKVSGVVLGTLSAAQVVGETKNINLSGTSFSIVRQFEGYRGWSDGAFAASCDGYKKSTGVYRYSGSVGSETYKIDADGAGPIPATNVWCDMTSESSTGFTELFMSSGAPVHARVAESLCNGFGLQLFVPRTNAHFAAARAKFGVGAFSIMGIYPKLVGATCIGSSFNSSGCSTWGPKTGSTWFVQSGLYITEPNGDNDLDGSMMYLYDSLGNISWYNDISNANIVSPGTQGGYLAANFVCSSKAE